MSPRKVKLSLKCISFILADVTSDCGFKLCHFSITKEGIKP